VLPDKQKKPFDFKAWDPSQTRQPGTVSLPNARRMAGHTKNKTAPCLCTNILNPP
jgi:hypothetical protein